jgi:phosphatidylglycerophosphatase A
VIWHSSLIGGYPRFAGASFDIRHFPRQYIGTELLRTGDRQLLSRPKNLWDWTALVLATGLGIGFVPVMPGTFGSLLGLLLAWTVGTSGWPVGFQVALEGAIFLAGIPICGRAARLFGRPDPGSVVYDEIAALPLVFSSVPLVFSTSMALPASILGFIWFRLFDIAKPWPVHRLERVPGGLGIMIDDVAAAVYAAIALWLSLKVWALLWTG